MTLPIAPPFPPMESRQSERIPRGEGWQYEPKWDGFRCIAFRDGDEVRLQSKSGRPLGRYFPDVVEAIGGLGLRAFVLDGELVIPVEGRLSFDQLQLRLHPAESRVRKLVAEHPAVLIVFDLLAEGGRDLTSQPLTERRRALERFAERSFDGPSLQLSPATTERKTAEAWLHGDHGGLDGVIAKRLDEPYRSGERAMRKIKRLRSADCVVGGFRYAAKDRGVGSLLLGLYDDEGLLHHVGFTSGFSDEERHELLRLLEPLAGGPSFTGAAPGAPSRWSRGRETDWVSLLPELVAEIRYDHFTGGRFRHGTRFLRWRPDKAPRRCTFEQVESADHLSLDLAHGD